MVRRSYIGPLLKIATAVSCSVGICFVGASASSLTYQSSTDVSFTFNPTISINVSDDLLISSLSPGSSADSNVITVSTATNNPTGYVLSASVGSSTNATTNLVNGSYNFSSIATDASLSSLTTNNTWGYSISDDNGSTWANYSGLPLYTSANWKEIASTNTSGTNDFKFKIGAKASSTQASGDYTNVINFTAVANPIPEPTATDYCTVLSAQYCMQDIAQWKEEVGDDDEVIAMDMRDGKEYTVRSLADGNLWMTQNLDHDIDSSYPYDSTNTDIPSNWNDTLTNTYATNDTTWHGYNNQPESYDPGDFCWSGEGYGVGGCPEDDYSHYYHLGNYYNWTAAVAMEDSSSHTTGAMDQSICPAGWKLPAEDLSGTGEHQILVEQYGWSDNTGKLEDYIMWDDPLNFPLSGLYSGYGSLEQAGNVGFEGYYWSSRLSDQYGALSLQFFYDEGVYPNWSLNRNYGAPIRCVTR